MLRRRVRRALTCAAAFAMRPGRRSTEAAVSSGLERRTHAMTRTELIIQLAKIVLGVAFGGYFLWWSVEVLHRLPPH
jgi:hypothetical protein